MPPATAIRSTTVTFESPVAWTSSDVGKSYSPRQKTDWGDVNDELLRIMRLKDDWDGMGAEAPSVSLVKHCLELVRQIKEELRPPNVVRASSDGHICFEWYGDRSTIEAEVSSEWVDWIVSHPNLPVEYQRISIDKMPSE